MLNGPFDFTRIPIASLGTKCLVHEKPAVRGTWAPHGVDGWYVGPARDHYRCYAVYIPSTKGTGYSETVEFFPFHVTMPATSSVDLVQKSAQDLLHLLRNPAPEAPFAVFGTETSVALAKLANIFAQLKPNTVLRPPTKPKPSPPKMALEFTNILNCYATAPRVQSQQPAIQPLYRPDPRVYVHPPTATPPSVPPPRFPDGIVPQPPPIQNSYTGTSQCVCRGEFIATEHRYPTRTRTSQLIANLLTAPSTGQHSNSSQYTAAANIISITEQLAPPAINAVLDPTTGASLEYRHLITGDTADNWIVVS